MAIQGLKCRTMLIKTVEDPPGVHQVIPGGAEIKQQGDELTVQCPACGAVTALVREAGAVGDPVRYRASHLVERGGPSAPDGP
jgi:hypothetical protein